MNNVTRNLVATSPLTGVKHCLAHTAFVDDLASRIATEHASIVPELCSFVQGAQRTSLLDLGLTVNTDTRQTMSRLLGPGAYSAKTQAIAR